MSFFVPILMPCSSWSLRWLSILDLPSPIVDSDPFYVLQYPFLPSSFLSSPCSSKVWFPLRHLLHYFFFSRPSHVAVLSQPLCLHGFHNVLSLQSLLALWVHQFLVDSFRYFLWSVDFHHNFLLVYDIIHSPCFIYKNMRGRFDKYLAYKEKTKNLEKWRFISQQSPFSSIHLTQPCSNFFNPSRKHVFWRSAM